MGWEQQNTSDAISSYDGNWTLKMRRKTLCWHMEPKALMLTMVAKNIHLKAILRSMT